MCEAPPAEEVDAPNLLSLPEDLIINIASLLKDRDIDGMERSSKVLHTSLTTSCRTWPTERQIDVKALFGVSPLSPEESRFVYLVRFSGYRSFMSFDVTSPIATCTNIDAMEGSLQVASEKGQEIYSYSLPLLRSDHAGRDTQSRQRVSFFHIATPAVLPAGILCPSS